MMGKLNQTIGVAARSGVAIYSLNAKGLDPFPSLDQSELENGMNALASDTGGRAFFNSDDLNQGLRLMLNENSFHYILGFYPLDDEERGRQFRRIVVRVKDRPEYIARAPKGYLPRAEKSLEEESLSPRQRLFREIAAPLPSNNLGLTVWADYLESPADDAQVTLQIHIDGNKLEYHEEREGRYRVELEIVTVIYDLAGKPIQTFTDTLGGDITADKLSQVKQNGFKFDRRITLKPGLYQARVGIREVATERISAGMALVETPNLRRNRLTLSSLLIAERKLSGNPAQLNDSLLPQSARRIGQGSELAYYLMIYNAVAPAGKLQMQVEVFHDQDLIYEDGLKPVAARLLGVNKKGIEVASQLILEDLPAGIYELRITVKDPRSGQKAQRARTIEVKY